MRADLLSVILTELNDSSGDIEASAVISVDGLAMFSVMPNGMNQDSVAAMSAALMSLGTRTSMELARGTLEQLLIKGSQGCMLMVGIGEQGVLTVLLKSNPNLASIINFVDIASSEITNLF